MSSVLDFILGSTYPEEVAYVYTDGKSAYELSEVREKMDKAGVTKTEEAKLKRQEKALKEALAQKRLEFHFQGLSPSARDTLFKVVEEKSEKEGWDETKRAEQLTGHLYAATIQKVIGPDGKEMEQEWTPDAIIEMFAALPNGATGDFIDKANKVSVRATDFDRAHDVSFS